MIKIPEFNLNTRFQKIQVANILELGPAESNSVIKLPQPFLPAGSGVIPFRHQTKLKVDTISSGKAGATLAGMVLEANVRGDYSPAKK